MDVLNKRKRTKSKGTSCAVVGCSNKYGKLSVWRKSVCEEHPPLLHEECPCLIPFRMFSFPKEEHLQKQWIVAINRKDFAPSKGSRVCSLHFLDLQPTSLNPFPTINLGYPKKVVKGRRTIQRFELVPRKRRRSITCEADQNVQASSGVNYVVEEDDIGMQQVLQQVLHVEQGTQCDMGCYHKILAQKHDAGSNASEPVKKDVRSRKVQASFGAYSYEQLSADKVHFYTGLQKTAVDALIVIFKKMDCALKCRLKVSDQLLLVLMRLRLGLRVEDLADRFSISPSTVSILFRRWIPTMSQTLGKLICWLPRETIKATLPAKFKQFYPNTTCVIDCAEVFMQRASRLRTRSETYSNYKSHNTVKFLVAIAPNGYVMYVSPTYGGRASDKHITLDSGFMDMLQPGDEVMADRGFTIGAELSMRGVRLNMPSFTHGNQLAEHKVTSTRRIASVRIHVERFIRRMKTYNILNTILPIRSIKLVEDIIIVCAALANLKPSLIK